MNRWVISAFVGGASLVSSLANALPTLTETHDLPAYHALSGESSVSGLSSGGFMAAQFHVAYSHSLIGAGVVAGGPWDCAGANSLAAPAFNAISQCMNPDHYQTRLPNIEHLAALAQQAAQRGDIDSLADLRSDHVYLFSGSKDHIVVPAVVHATEHFYEAVGVPAQSIIFNHTIAAGHGFITDKKTDSQCGKTAAPYINNCHLDLAQQILETIYGPLNPPANSISGHLVMFDQQPFVPGVSVQQRQQSYLADKGYVYIPTSCDTDDCRVHIAFHGCEQNAGTVGTYYISETGYMEMAETNDLIVLFPQVKKGVMNPHGCWDFWGYTSNNMPPYQYYTKRAPQMAAIKAMLDRLTSAEVTARIVR